MCNAEEYLGRIELLDSQINDRWEDLQRLYSMRTKMTTIFSMAPAHGSGSKSNVEDLTIKIMQMEVELNRKIDAFIDYKAEVMNLLEQLNDAKQSKLLHKIYFDYMDIEDLAYEMGKCTKTIEKRRDEALQKVAVLLLHRKEAGGEIAVNKDG